MICTIIAMNHVIQSSNPNFIPGVGWYYAINFAKRDSREYLRASTCRAREERCVKRSKTGATYTQINNTS